MKTPIIIREYQSNDFDLVIDSIRLNTPQFFAAEEEKDLCFYLQNEIEEYFVIELNQAIIGCGGINIDGNTGKISWDIIHPDFQGKGIGKKLLEFRLQLLKADTTIKKIMVRTSNLAYNFYQKSGFKLIHQSPDYWGIGFDLYEMEYVL